MVMKLREVESEVGVVNEARSVAYGTLVEVPQLIRSSSGHQGRLSLTLDCGRGRLLDLGAPIACLSTDVGTLATGSWARLMRFRPGAGLRVSGHLTFDPLFLSLEEVNPRVPKTPWATLVTGPCVVGGYDKAGVARLKTLGGSTFRAHMPTDTWAEPGSTITAQLFWRAGRPRAPYRLTNVTLSAEAPFDLDEAAG